MKTFFVSLAIFYLSSNVWSQTADEIMTEVIARQPQTQWSMIHVWKGPTVEDPDKPDLVIEAMADFGDEFKLAMAVRTGRKKQYLALTEKNSAKTRFYQRVRGKARRVKGSSLAKLNIEGTGLSHRDLQRESFARFEYKLLEIIFGENEDAEDKTRYRVKATPTPKDSFNWYRVLKISSNYTILSIEILDNNKPTKLIINHEFKKVNKIVTPVVQSVWVPGKMDIVRVSYLKTINNRFNGKSPRGVFDPKMFKNESLKFGGKNWQ